VLKVGLPEVIRQACNLGSDHVTDISKFTQLFANCTNYLFGKYYISYLDQLFFKKKLHENQMVIQIVSHILI